jgi:hypothetical protein
MAHFDTAPVDRSWYTRRSFMGLRRARLVLLALVGAPWIPARVGAAPCPDTATVSVYVDNQSDDERVTVEVRGELLDASSTCGVLGDVSYETTLSCVGSGEVFCGVVTGLRPGSWAHTVTTTVTGSDPQHQARRQVLVGADDGGSNVVEWTIHPRTFQVGTADDQEFQADLAAAEAYTAAHPGRFALVTFARAAFPSAAAPVTIRLGFEPQSESADFCEPTVDCGTPPRKTRVCLDGSRVVVDALDDRGQPGAVVLAVGKCATSLMRITGSDNVLRGLDLLGSMKGGPNFALDTVAVSGGDARGNRLESLIVRGPTLGDGISVEGPDGSGPAEVTVTDTIVMNAEDKGVKVRDGARVTITDSCIHDNRNGGVQATFGGHARVERSVVQFNAPGAAENGLSAGVPEDVANENRLETDGNVIRFAGSRGISVVNNADAVLLNDFVAENQDGGLVVETTAGGVQPAASARGLTLACNHAEISRPCMAQQSVPCVRHADCATSCGSVSPDGFGIVVRQCDGCLPPLTDFGPMGIDPGRNAITRNAGPGGNGINFRNALLGDPAPVIVARGNHWERCNVPPLPEDNRCNGAAIAAGDVRPAGSVDVGNPILPHFGPNPIVVDVQPRRPRKGDMVRVYNGVLSGNGGPFNVIDGIACRTGGIDGPTGLPLGLPADRCDARSFEVATANHSSPRGNKVQLTVGADSFGADAVHVYAVTPSMLVFEMPVDCHSPGTLKVFRGTDEAAPFAICDVGGCTGREAGALCDDGNACTVEDRCDGAGACVSGAALECEGACDTGTCDPSSGCVRTPAGGACDDGDLCTVGDSCTAAGECLTGSPRSCEGECLTGECQRLVGCLPLPSTTACDDDDACTEEDRCSGVDERCLGGPGVVCADDDDPCTLPVCDAEIGCTIEPAADGTQCETVDACRGPATCIDGGCDPGPAIVCDDGDVCTDDACDPLGGCYARPLPAFDAVLCRVSEMRALVEGASALPRKVARKLRHRIAKVDGAVMRANSTNRPARAERMLERAARALVKLAATLQRVRGTLDPSLEGALRHSLEDAQATVTVLRADA